MRKAKRFTGLLLGCLLAASAWIGPGSLPRTEAAAPDLTLQAENYASMNGILNNGTTIGSFDNGDWLAYNNVDFGNGYSTFTADVAVAPSNAGQKIEVRLDSPTGTLIGTLTVASTGDWNAYAEQSAGLTAATGVHTLYLKAVGTYGVANVDYFRLSGASSGGSGTLLQNPGFETGSLSPWTTQNNASVVTGHAHSGTYAANLGGAYSGVQQTVTGLQPNTTYTLTAWVQSSGDVIYLGAKNYAGTGSEVNTTTSSSAYTQLSVSFTTDSATTSAYIFLYKNDNTGTSYADDLSLTSASLTANPGFETGALSPWTTQNNATIVTGHAHSGTYAANLGGTSSGVEQTVTGLKPNNTYTLSAWVQSSGDVVYLGAKNYAGSGTEVNATTTSTSYSRLSVTFTTNSSTTSAYLFLWKAANTGASYADDVTLTEAVTAKYSGQNLGFNTQDPYFQPDAATLGQLYDKVASTGAKWVRATLFWDLMEPSPGNYDWSKADMIFNTIKAKGLKVDIVVRSAPSWAAGNANTSDHNYAPTDNVSYGNICYQIAKRYLNRGVTIAFELGNEQNTQFFNMPSVDPAAYTRNMLIPGSNGIRRAASELGVAAPTIMVGGFAPVEPAYVAGSVAPLDFMQAIYDNGGKGYFDTIAYHPYTYDAAPASSHWTFTQLQAVINLMNSKGDTNRKVWATEAGWATGTGGGEVSEAAQATYTGQLLDLWFGLPYAGPMLWYELVDNASYDNANRENTFGLLHSGQPWTEKPAYGVFLSKVAP